MKIIPIKVIPSSSRNTLSEHNGIIKVKLTAHPIDGKANKKLKELLSKEWKIPQSKIHIIKGQKSKNKIISIDQ